MATVEILCRFDAAHQTPVVFLRDSIQGDKIQVWNGQGKPQLMPIDYYRMTSPLSAEDERVLAERFKSSTGRQDSIVHINHRMPRVSKALPNLLTSAPSQGLKDINEPPKPEQKRSGAKPIEAQAQPEAPTGDLPAPNEVPAPLPQASAPVDQPAPGTANVNEPASTVLFNRIKELNARMGDLSQKIASLNAEVANATTDYNTAKQAVEELKPELVRAIEAEAAEEMNKRKAMLAALTDGPTLADAAQALHDAGTAQDATKAEGKPVDPPKAEAAPKPANKAGAARGTGGKFTAKASAKTAAVKK